MLVISFKKFRLISKLVSFLQESEESLLPLVGLLKFYFDSFIRLLNSSVLVVQFVVLVDQLLVVLEGDIGFHLFDGVKLIPVAL